MLRLCCVLAFRMSSSCYVPEGIMSCSIPRQGPSWQQWWEWLSFSCLILGYLLQTYTCLGTFQELIQATLSFFKKAVCRILDLKVSSCYNLSSLGSLDWELLPTSCCLDKVHSLALNVKDEIHVWLACAKLFQKLCKVNTQTKKEEIWDLLTLDCSPFIFVRGHF